MPGDERYARVFPVNSSVSEEEPYRPAPRPSLMQINAWGDLADAANEHAWRAAALIGGIHPGELDGGGVPHRPSGQTERSPAMG
jgi:hypothetical protein